MAKIQVTICPVCGHEDASRRKLDAHILKTHGKVMDKNGRSLMDADVHPARSNIYASKGRPMTKAYQGGAPGLGKKR